MTSSELRTVPVPFGTGGDELIGLVVCVLGKVAVYESPAFPDKLWLNHIDGEGGCFDRAEVLAVIEQGPEPLERYFWERF